MTFSTRIRHVSDSDWDSIVALEASTYEASGLSEGRVELKSRADVSPATCLVLEIGQQIAGYVLSLPYPKFQCPDLNRTEEFAFRSRNLHLHDLVIADRFRHGGLGTHLLNHLTATAGASGYEWISLVAVAGSDTFWSANGYCAFPRLLLPTSYGAGAVYMSSPI
jgi:ribosomal protein S18 acetylase RimI-like enzyme